MSSSTRLTPHSFFHPIITQKKGKPKGLSFLTREAAPAPNKGPFRGPGGRTSPARTAAEAQIRPTRTFCRDEFAALSYIKIKFFCLFKALWYNRLIDYC
jgi:hypothetical protein